MKLQWNCLSDKVHIVSQVAAVLWLFTRAGSSMSLWSFVRLCVFEILPSSWLFILQSVMQPWNALTNRCQYQCSQVDYVVCLWDLWCLWHLVMLLRKARTESLINTLGGNFPRLLCALHCSKMLCLLFKSALCSWWGLPIYKLQLYKQPVTLYCFPASCKEPTWGSRHTCTELGWETPAWILHRSRCLRIHIIIAFTFLLFQMMQVGPLLHEHGWFGIHIRTRRQL